MNKLQTIITIIFLTMCAFVSYASTDGVPHCKFIVSGAEPGVNCLDK